MLSNRPHPFARWLVCLAVLLGTLMPTLSQALASARDEVTVSAQICRASVVSPGASLIAAKAAGEKDSLHGLFEHCPFCAVHAQDLVPPPTTWPLAVRLDLKSEMPERFLSAAVTAHCWMPALARVPPNAI